MFGLTRALYFSIIMIFGRIDATGNGDLSRTVLVQIPQRDFAGDGAFRVGHVIYSHLSPTVGDRCCSVPREAFDARTSPLFVVTSWKLISDTPLGETRATFTVGYHVVAFTEGDGYVRSKGAVKRFVGIAPRDEVISYNARIVHGRWMLVDPPLPRVGASALLRIIDQEVVSDQKIASRLPGSYPRNGGLFTVIRSMQEQRAQLRNILRNENVALE